MTNVTSLIFRPSFHKPFMHRVGVFIRFSVACLENDEANTLDRGY